MKCSIPEISWHNKEPILSIDVQPLENDFYRLATGGSDYHVLIWHGRIADNGAVTLDVVSDLTRHQRAVNVVRWSPSGQYLASGDDDANIIVWNLKTDNIPLLEDSNDKEVWVIAKIMRGHKEDIYDLCWSPSGLKIISGSIDNTAIIWDFTKGKTEHILTDHKGFVQGVSWDPKGELIATLSSDRTCRVFEGNGKQLRARISKGTLPVPESHSLFEKEVKYFHDDTFKSYFRRITFTPDGNLIVAPAGCVETEDAKKALCGTYLFTLDCLPQPIAVLPLQKQCSVAVRCSPILYELRSEGPDPVIDLPYRMIIAVATESDLILYDTQQIKPFAHLQRIHYTRLTDLAWSADGRLLVVSSTDGFCTLVTFDIDELGTRYTKEEEEIDENYLNVSGCEELNKSITVEETKNKEDKGKKESFLVQWANKIKEDVSIKHMDVDKLVEGKQDKISIESNENGTPQVEVIKKIAEPMDTIEIDDSPVKNDNDIKKITPRRIIPIKLSSSTGKEKKKTTPSSKPTPGKKRSKQTDSSPSKEARMNSLMNFLKAAAEKEKANEATVSISEESSSARDAWSSDGSRYKNHTINLVDDGKDEITEPIPDFSLQLEESTTRKEAKCSELIVLEDSTEAQIDNSDNQRMPNGENEGKVKDVYCNIDKNISCTPEVKQAAPQKLIEDVKKTPRRIQLITLSSPKHKKQKPSNT
ncbi:putative chromatin assembly factor 1 subunit [Trypoxylus dichotomus]